MLPRRPHLAAPSDFPSRSSCAFAESQDINNLLTAFTGGSPASPSRLGQTMQSATRILLTVAVCALGALGAWAGDLPAISGINGKISAEGGAFDDSGAGIALGTLGVPLGHYLGLQADGAIGTIDGETMGGGGLHLFTRDPSSYLLGVYGSYHTWDSIDIWRLAGEAELYLGRFTLSALAGYENVEVPNLSDGLVVLTQDDQHFFGQFDASYYVTDDFKLSAGYRYLNESSFGAASAEYLIRGFEVPVSLFARGYYGDGDYNAVTGGLKIYFSDDPNKSLIDRNRRDDPENYLPVFPKLATKAGTPVCKVSAPADETTTTDCICPSGTVHAGGHPQTITIGVPRFFCGMPA